MVKVNASSVLFETLQTFTGISMKEIESMMEEKTKVLKYMVRNGITSIEGVGKIMALYYTEKKYLMEEIVGKDGKL